MSGAYLHDKFDDERKMEAKKALESETNPGMRRFFETQVEYYDILDKAKHSIRNKDDNDIDELLAILTEKWESKFESEMENMYSDIIDVAVGADYKAVIERLLDSIPERSGHHLAWKMQLEIWCRDNHDIRRNYLNRMKKEAEEQKARNLSRMRL